MFQWISAKESLPPLRVPVLIRSLTEDGEIYNVAKRAEVWGIWATRYGASPANTAEVWVIGDEPLSPEEAEQITHWALIPRVE